MNIKQTKKIIKKIEYFFPHNIGNIGFYSSKKDYIKNATKTWHTILCDYDYNEVKAMLKHYVISNRSKPTIADLINGLSIIEEEYDAYNFKEF